MHLLSVYIYDIVERSYSMADTMVITRKLTLYPVGDKAEIDRVYKYIRDGMEVQSYMMNMCMSAMYTAKLNKASKEEIKELTKHYSHVPSSKLGSPYNFDIAKYPTGLPIAGSVPRACKQKFDKACKDGLMYGRVSLPTFKKTMPMMVHNDFINIRPKKKKNALVDNGFYHEYDNYESFYEALMKEVSPKLFIKFANGITFKVILGSPHRSQEIRTMIDRMFTNEYEICDSSIGISSKGKIELNLSLKIPLAENKLDEDVTVGVDLGLAIPVMMALNNNLYERKSFGSYDEFTRQRIKIQAEKRRIQRSLKNTSGGHGRTKKLIHLEKIQKRERNFAKTFNHNASKQVVQYALANNAKYINVEDLSGYDSQDFVLRNWSYYELQQMITYKAKKEGIEVRKIKPQYTSQTCSICGERGIRSSQSVFECTNPDCKCHKLYDKFNADFNAARNIAMSENYSEK